MQVKQASTTAQGTRLRMLVVEDERVVAMDIQNRLRDLGFEVIGIARDGDEAIDKARDLGPDVILMDVRIPGPIDGIEAAEIIRRDSPAPIIFLTAFCDQATVERARKSEPCAYLLKPFTEAELLSAIEIVLQKWRIESRVRQRNRLLSTSRPPFGSGVATTDENGVVSFLKPITTEPMETILFEGNETILVIEDDAAIREAMDRILCARGYRVLAARDGGHALELARSEPGAIHLVLSDIVLPGGSWPDLASQIAGRHREAKVLLLSAILGPSVSRDGDMSAGMFLHKPFDADQLLAKVRAVLDG